MQNPRLRLQWIVLSGLPCAPGAPSVEQIRFALFTTGSQEPVREALPLLSILSTLP
jgi:hypothetical protein